MCAMVIQIQYKDEKYLNAGWVIIIINFIIPHLWATEYTISIQFSNLCRKIFWRKPKISVNNILPSTTTPSQTPPLHPTSSNNSKTSILTKPISFSITSISRQKKMSMCKTLWSSHPSKISPLGLIS